jgi:tripartite-type tricarboxylate transporter receptor subunit TctC
VVDKVQADVAKVMATAAVRDGLRALGAEPIASSPAALSHAMKTDYDRYGEIVRRLGIRAE